MRIKVRKIRDGRGRLTYYIRIPAPVYRLLGEPEEFEMELKGENIILKPVKE